MAALNWLLAVLTGPLAIAVATLAVAGIGLAMLGGRADWRRGGGVVAGCILIFGATRIGGGLMALAPATPSPDPAGDAPPPLPPEPPAPPPPPPPTGDNLAGAYAAARQAVAIRFPTASGTARLTARIGADGQITRLHARGDGLDPAVLETVARVVTASGIRLPAAVTDATATANATTVDLPPLPIGGPP